MASRSASTGQRCETSICEGAGGASGSEVENALHKRGMHSRATQTSVGLAMDKCTSLSSEGCSDTTSGDLSESARSEDNGREATTRRAPLTT